MAINILKLKCLLERLLDFYNLVSSSSNRQITILQLNYFYNLGINGFLCNLFHFMYPEASMELAIWLKGSMVSQRLNTLSPKDGVITCF